MTRRIAVAGFVLGLLALAGPAEGQRVSPTASVSGLTSVSGTTNRVPYFDAATTLAASELERTDANTLKLLSTTAHICWNTATGVRLDAAGSLSFSNCSTGHASGLGLGTTTPKTVLTETMTRNVLNVADGAAHGVLAVGGLSGGILDFYDTNATVNVRRARMDLSNTTWRVGRVNDDASVTVPYLTGELSTDAVTLGNASVTALTLNPGTADDVVVTDTKGVQVSGGGGVNVILRHRSGIGGTLGASNGAGFAFDTSPAVVPFASAALADNGADLGSATYRWRTARLGTSYVLQGANGQLTTEGKFEESHTLAAAATSDTTATIAADSRTRGAVFRITTTITGCATVDAGITGATSRFGTFSALTAGTTLVSTDNSAYSTATKIRFSCVGGGGSFTAGVIRVTPFYDALTAPTS